MHHHVYILRCADGTLYTGYTTDLARRVAEHNGVDAATQTGAGGAAARRAAARYTRARRPVTLLYSEAHETRGAALTREAAIKRLSRTKKLALIRAGRTDSE